MRLHNTFRLSCAVMGWMALPLPRCSGFVLLDSFDANWYTTDGTYCVNANCTRTSTFAPQMLFHEGAAAITSIAVNGYDFILTGNATHLIVHTADISTGMMAECSSSEMAVKALKYLHVSGAPYVLVAYEENSDNANVLEFFAFDISTCALGQEPVQSIVAYAPQATSFFYFSGALVLVVLPGIPPGVHCSQALIFSQISNTSLRFTYTQSLQTYCRPITSPTLVCARASTGSSASITCPTDSVIASFPFLSYGRPNGTCAAPVRTTCEASGDFSPVYRSCIGQSTCSIAATAANFGDPCPGQNTSLSIVAACQGNSSVGAVPILPSITVLQSDDLKYPVLLFGASNYPLQAAAWNGSLSRFTLSPTTTTFPCIGSQTLHTMNIGSRVYIKATCSNMLDQEVVLLLDPLRNELRFHQSFSIESPTLQAQSINLHDNLFMLLSSSSTLRVYVWSTVSVAFQLLQSIPSLPVFHIATLSTRPVVLLGDASDHMVVQMLSWSGMYSSAGSSTSANGSLVLGSCILPASQWDNTNLAGSVTMQTSGIADASTTVAASRLSAYTMTNDTSGCPRQVFFNSTYSSIPAALTQWRTTLTYASPSNTGLSFYQYSKQLAGDSAVSFDRVTWSSSGNCTIVGRGFSSALDGLVISLALNNEVCRVARLNTTALQAYCSLGSQYWGGPAASLAFANYTFIIPATLRPPTINVASPMMWGDEISLSAPYIGDSGLNAVRLRTWRNITMDLVVQGVSANKTSCSTRVLPDAFMDTQLQMQFVFGSFVLNVTQYLTSTPLYAARPIINNTFPNRRLEADGGEVIMVQLPADVLTESDWLCQGMSAPVMWRSLNMYIGAKPCLYAKQILPSLISCVTPAFMGPSAYLTVKIGDTITLTSNGTQPVLQLHNSSDAVQAYAQSHPSVTPATTVTPARTASPLPTQSASNTATPSNTASTTTTLTATSTSTPSNTLTQTSTSSQTVTATMTGTETITPSVTRSVTSSFTATVTASVTASVSASWTASLTAAVTTSPSSSVSGTVSGSSTQTRTPSMTSSVTYTVTPSETRTMTPSQSSSTSMTVTPSETVTQTASRTSTLTMTVTPSETVTSTTSQTSSKSSTVTPSNSMTYTPSETSSSSSSVTASNTVTSSASQSASKTNTITSSQTITSTSSETSSRSNTMTPSQSMTISPSTSVTASETGSLSPSETVTTSATMSITPTETSSHTASESASLSNTPSGSTSVTATRTATGTDASTASITLSPSSSESGTPSAMPTASDTVSPSPTSSSSFSPTASATASATPSQTTSPSATESGFP